MGVLELPQLPIEMDHGNWYYAAGVAATLLVPCITVLLTAIETDRRDVPATPSLNPNSPPPSDSATAE
jgi:hypothetical protein